MMTHTQISDLADADLCAILERLPPYDRLIASEVCRRWYRLSRKPWPDVKSLDLSSIPLRHINAISNQCQNLKSVFAFRRTLRLSDLARLAKSSSLSAVKLYDGVFTIADTVLGNAHFAANFTHVSWSELIIHNVLVIFADLVFTSACFPSSLTRLQLSALRIGTQNSAYCADLLVHALNGLQNLECLILHAKPDPYAYCSPSCNNDPVASALRSNQLARNLGTLKRLKELCIGPVAPFVERNLGLIAGLPKLEVLFLNDVDGDEVPEVLTQLITKHSTLRILVLSGKFSQYNWAPAPFDLPASNRFPDCFCSDPLPLLHVFVDKEASEKIRFAKSSSDASVIHPINQPMPEFLEREDIAPIFEGVWMAEKIKEAARNGGRLWNYHIHDTARSVQYIEI